MANRRIARSFRLPPLPSMRDVLRVYRLKALRELSQNFLMDERITERIVKAAGDISGAHVCEVGPGPGPITRAILRKNPAQLLCVEKDKRFLPSLELLGEAVRPDIDFSLVTGDILKTPLHDAFPYAAKKEWNDDPPNVHIIGNLPFSVSTILVIRWLEAISHRRDAWTYGRVPMTLTFQKEVAERMVAPILSRQRCRLSVMCQNWCKVEYKFNISGKAFVPQPDVDVGVITLTPLKKPLIPLEFKMIEKFLRVMFHTKQKYSSKCARNLFPEELKDLLTDRLFQAADLEPMTRPIQVSNEEFKRLLYAYRDIVEEYPDVADYNFRAQKVPAFKQAATTGPSPEAEIAFV